MNKILLWIIGITVILGIGAYLLIEFKFKKWRCREGKCEKVLGGDFSSLDKCKESCKAKQTYDNDHNRRIKQQRRLRAYEEKKKKKVTWSPNLVDFAPEPLH